MVFTCLGVVVWFGWVWLGSKPRRCRRRETEGDGGGRRETEGDGGRRRETADVCVVVVECVQSVYAQA